MLYYLLSRFKLWLGLGLCLVSLPVVAQNPALMVIKAGRLVEVQTGQVLTNQALVIEGNRIKSVQPFASLTIPPGAKVLDLSKATVLPGLMDVHTHLTSDPYLGGYRGLGVSVPREALYGVKAARQTLQAGFTTVRNVGAAGYSDVALRDAINAGDIPGPRMVVSGPAIGITGGHCDNNLLAPEYKDVASGVADGPWAVRAKVREVIKYGADVIKICATGGVLSKGTQPGIQQLSLEEMQAIVLEARQLGRKVAAHAHGTEGAKAAIRAGVDSVEHASLIDEEGMNLAKQKGTYLVMDVYVSDFILKEGEAAGILPESIEKERKIGQLQRDNFARVVKAGTLLAFGSDAGVYPHGDNARQFAYMVKYGLSPMAAIQTATLNAARLLGLASQLGSLEPGKYADLIAVEQDPLQNIQALEKVSFVMKDGQVIKNVIANP